MTDDLDRAVDERIHSYRPATVPPFAVIEERKRRRDRRRLAAGAGGVAFSALAVAGVLVLVPTLASDGDRLTPGTPVGGEVGTRFEVGYVPDPTRAADPAAYADDIERCAGLPGVTRDVAGGANAGDYVLVARDEAVDALADCLADVDAAAFRAFLREGVGERQTVFGVSSNGTAGAADYAKAVENCLALPGVIGSAVQESYPAKYELLATGADSADALARCLADAPAVDVTRSSDDQAAEPGTPRIYTIRPEAGAPDGRQDQAREACFQSQGIRAVKIGGRQDGAYRVVVPSTGVAAFERCINAIPGLNAKS